MSMKVPITESNLHCGVDCGNDNLGTGGQFALASTMSRGMALKLHNGARALSKQSQ